MQDATHRFDCKTLRALKKQKKSITRQKKFPVKKNKKSLSNVTDYNKDARLICFCRIVGSERWGDGYTGIGGRAGGAPIVRK